MGGYSDLAQVICDILSDRTYQASMNRIAQGALKLTHSRHSMIAILSPSVGQLTIGFASSVGKEEGSSADTLPIAVGHEVGVVGYVAATGSTIEIGDVTENPHYLKLFDSTQSELATPIRDADGRVRAVLNVESDVLHAFNDSHSSALSALASVAGTVIDRSDHLARERALIEVAGALESTLTEEALLGRVIDVADQVLNLQACSIFLLDSKKGSYYLRASLGAFSKEVGRVHYKAGEGFTGWVAQNSRPILLDNPQQDPRWRGKSVEFPSEQIASFVAVPIRSKGMVIGVVRALRRKLENPFIDNRFTLSDLRLIEAISELLATGLEKLRSMERIIRSERMIAWGELSAKSSHMIGNRVFAVRGDVNELKHLAFESPPDLTAARAVIRSLETNVDRIEEILQDFRDFLTATQLQKDDTDINQLVRETAGEVFPKRSKVALRLELGEVPSIFADGRRLRRAISELIENSLAHSDHGTMTIRTRLVERAAGIEGGRSDHATVELEVEDTGPGIPPSDKKRIFEPFFSGKVKGMGLGLSIVKGIVEAHGGNVREAGTEGSGAKFILNLPVAKPTNQTFAR